MDDLFKKFINTGVGFLSQGNKRVQTVLDKLVQDSKISEQEGKKIMDDLLKSGESKRKDLEKQLQTLAGSLKDRVSKSSEAAAPAPKAKAKAAPKKAAAPAPANAPAAKKTPVAKPAKAKKTTPSPDQE
ncbi:phasin family protein [Hymenobacter bucti]|uniref:Phasin family protein n=1 Tax=Hymenobacter bucti TaxID=1844114 RepID=A0ABW4QRH0_9BACT